MNELQKIALYLNKVTSVIRSTSGKTPQSAYVKLGWMDGDYDYPRGPRTKNEETQVLASNNGMGSFWIANNCPFATQIQAEFLSCFGINSFVTLRAHVLKYDAALNNYSRMNVGSAKKPGGLAGKRPAKAPKLPPSSMRAAVSIINKTDSGTVTVHSASSSSADLGPVNRLGLKKAFVPFAFVNLSYEKESGHPGTEFHAEQQLLAALSMLDKRFVSGRHFKLTGCKPPCAVCAPVIRDAIWSLAGVTCTLDLIDVAGEMRKDSPAAKLDSGYFPLPSAESRIGQVMQVQSDIAPHLPAGLGTVSVSSIIASFLVDTPDA